MFTKAASKSSLLAIKVIGRSSLSITKIASGSNVLVVIATSILSILANTASSSPYKDSIIIASRPILAIRFLLLLYLPLV